MSGLSFTFNYAAGGSTTQSVMLDGLVGGQTVVFNQAGLSSVTFSSSGPSTLSTAYQFDNVVVTAAVSEPESLALMLGGLAAVGGAIRRRTRA